MARRKPYTKLEKTGQQRPDHVKGMGDVLFKVFQCLAPNCRAFIIVRVADIGAEFHVPCPECGFELTSGGETKFFDYQLVHKEENEVIEDGSFAILHDDYLTEAHEFKHCVLCYTLKPVEFFDRHASRKSGFQSECRLCKTMYNGIKNQSRIADQHREASQRRRLYRQLATEGGRIDSKVVFDKFDGKCFNCDAGLKYTTKGQRTFHLDHTLPARLLWPMTTDTATLLCGPCNNQKHDQWPSVFYDDAKLKRLSVLTGYEYALLAGPPHINKEAVSAILDDVNSFIETWIHYPEDIKKVRRLIRDREGIDIFDHAPNIPGHLREPDEINE